MYLKLTRILQDLTKEAQKRVEEFHNNQDKPLVDEDGRNAEWYSDMGMVVPEELVPVKELIIEEKDYVYNYSNYICNTDKVEDFDELEDGTTLISYDSGVEIVVKESVEQIYNQILNNK